MATQDLGRVTRLDGSTAGLAVVCASHWISHYHLLLLPLLFPFFKDHFGVGFIELGLGITVFSVVSGLTQAPVGYIVDRFGAKMILVCGICIGSTAFIFLGISLTYPSFLICAALAGLANSVYHPGDYAIIASVVDERRMGRAFSIHTFAGFLGGAVAPAIMVVLVSAFTVRGALIASGLMGFVAAFAVLVVPVRPKSQVAKAEVAPGGNAVLTPAILMLTLLFTMISLASSGITGFSIVAFINGRGISFETANVALTAYLSMSAAGVLVGGYLADRTHRHDLVATINYGLNGVVILVVALVAMPPPLLIVVMGFAGFLSGSITASRDMMVRKASPPGAIGRAFGIVSTGFNIGGIIGPLLYGWIMDHGMPLWVFYVTAVFMVGTSLATLLADHVRRSSQAAESP